MRKRKWITKGEEKGACDGGETPCIYVEVESIGQR
jgi:hypothetical protein